MHLGASASWTSARRRTAVFQWARAIVVAGFLGAVPDPGRVLAAQETCIPRAVGVPGLPGPPVWWDADNNGTLDSPAEWDRFDDPRWHRAASHTDGTASAEHVDFRALHHGGKLYLSWEVKFDPGGLQTGSVDNLDGDALLVGLRMGGIAAAIRLVLKNVPVTPGGPAMNAGAGGFEINIREWDAVNGWGLPATTLPWLERTSLWARVDADGKAWWAFAMVISQRLGTALAFQTDDTFEMWYTYLVYTTPVFGYLPTEYHWPRSRANIFVEASDTSPVPVLSNAPAPGAPSPSPDWGAFVLKQAATSCSGDVAIDAVNVGTFDVSLTQPSSLISLTGQNTLVARPTNLGDTSFHAQTITASFFLANWGSVPDASTLWRQISPAPSPSNQGAIAAGTTADQASEIAFPWTVPPGDVCRYDPACDPPGRRHQCLLVELSSRAPLRFVNKSVYRNMDFVPASTFSRDAEVSVVGLQASEGTATRDVYLYLELLNMPERVDAAYLPADTVAPEASLARRTAGGKDPIIIPAAASRRRRAAIMSAAAMGLLAQPQIDSLMPTYRVHVYHATGDSMTIGDGKRPVLRAQTSFGYWVDHSGSLRGWEARLTGVGLEELTPRWYRIAVPHNGFAVVRTTIRALDAWRFAFSVHGGVSLPHGALANTADRGFGATADFELRLNSTFSLEALYGLHRFPGIGTSGDVDLTHIAGGLRAYLTHGVTSLFISGGGGMYTFDPGVTDRGAHAGAGVRFNPSFRIALEVGYTAHTVFTSASNTTVSSIQVGGRVRF